MHTTFKNTILYLCLTKLDYMYIYNEVHHISCHTHIHNIYKYISVCVFVCIHLIFYCMTLKHHLIHYCFCLYMYCIVSIANWLILYSSVKHDMINCIYAKTMLKIYIHIFFLLIVLSEKE